MPRSGAVRRRPVGSALPQPPCVRIGLGDEVGTQAGFLVDADAKELISAAVESNIGKEEDEMGSKRTHEGDTGAISLALRFIPTGRYW